MDAIVGWLKQALLGRARRSERVGGRPPGPIAAPLTPRSDVTPIETGQPLDPNDRIGILFVHGMGDHQRGDFLRQLGEPLYAWITAWLGQDDLNSPARTIRARQSSFRVPHLGDHDAPAHSLVETVVDGPDGRRRCITWLATDGWWADEVVAPSFGQVASWGLGLAPWMIVRYFRRHWHGLLLLPSLVLVVLFQLLILALSIFGAIPRLRDYVAGLQLRITGSLGDVMVMVASPLQFNAMTTRLVSDLHWLRTRVPQGRIAVVAHSQGTGVAHAALQASHVPVDLLVTFGTALEKLHVAREVQQNPRRLALGSSLTIAGGILLVFAVATWLNAHFGPATASASVVGRWLLGAGAVLLLARMGLWFHLPRLGGALLTAGGVAAVLVGLVLTAQALADADRHWRASLRAMTATRFWRAWSDAWWHRAALTAVVVGLLIVVAREYAAIAMRERNEVGAPSPRPATRPFDRVPVLNLALDPSSAVGNVTGAATLILGLFCVAMAEAPDRSSEGNAIMVLVVAGLAFCFAAVPIPIAKVTEPRAQDFRLPRREGRLQWHNYWASADPVPDGNLPIDDVSYVTNHEVRNRGSMLADHTMYTENREEFLADLVLHLSALADWPAIEPADRCCVTRARQRRRWRVGFLTVARWMSSVGMVATWWILGSVGLAVLGHPLAAVVGYVAGLFPGVERQTVERWLADPLLGMVAVAAITFFWYRGVLSPAWRYWDLVEADVLFQRRRADAQVRVLLRERIGAIVLFALASAVGICAAIWSPNLVRLVGERLKVLGAPQTHGHDDWARLPHESLWGLPWPFIGLVTIIVTAIYATVIWDSIRRHAG